MSGRQLQEVLDSHGGVVSVHTHPATCRHAGRAGWANTLVCRDGYRRTLARWEERALLRGARAGN